MGAPAAVRLKAAAGALILAAAGLAARPAPAVSAQIASAPGGVASASAAASGGFVPGSAADIRRQGTWLRDGQGRYLLFRGVSLASRSKLPPYVPVLPLAVRRLDARLVGAELARLEPQIRLLRDAGVNVVRLLVIWKALEPEYQENLVALPPSGVAYLAAMRQVVDALYSHGMFVIVDFHQDIASEAYGGDGFPDWALAVDGDHPRPATPPGADLWWGIRYYALPGSALSKAVRYTMQSFWRNSVTNTTAGLAGVAAQSHLVRVVALTAAFFSDHPAVLGYEPFNEPHQVGMSKEAFERDVLGRFYDAVRREVARVHPSAFVFVEPRMDWTTFPADQPEPSVLRPWSIFAFTDHPRTFLDLRSAPDARVAFSFHYYDPYLLVTAPFRKSLRERMQAWPGLFAEIDAAIRADEAVPFLTEFGCDQNWTERPDVEPDAYASVARACMDGQYREIEARLFNAIYWNYDFYSRRGASGRPSENWNEENLSLLGPEGPQNLDVAARPYPMRSSARPVRVAFDFPSRQGAIVLEGVVTEAPTIVFIPQRFHYSAGGFEVRATSRRAPEWDGARGLLYWWPDPGEPRNALVVSGARRFEANALPAGVEPLVPRMGRWAFAGR